MSRGPAHWKSSDVAWRGGTRPYDLAKEVLVQLGVVAGIVIILTLLFASPDPPAMTFQQWAKQAPVDFATTTVAELDGTSLSATYGPPYQPASQQDGSLQGFGFFSPQKWVGARIPVDPPVDYVQQPLQRAGDQQALQAFSTWSSASSRQQADWAKAYTDALATGTFSDGGITVASGDYGPLPAIVGAQYRYALSGGLDAALQATNRRTPAGFPIWFSNDQTRSLLYFGDSGQGGDDKGCISPGAAIPNPDTCWYYNQANANAAPRFGGYLDGGTWGVVNEVGNWPGAWWLFPYSFWYQWGYGANGASGDLYAMLMTGMITLPFLFLPWIPGLRDIPKRTRLYRRMWSDYYDLVEREKAEVSTTGPGAGGGIPRARTVTADETEPGRPG